MDFVRGEVDLLDMSFRDEGSITLEEECRPECKLENNFNNLNQVILSNSYNLLEFKSTDSEVTRYLADK